MIDYRSPIEIWHSEMEMRMEDEVLKACQRIGVQVDKEELLKALRYDRGQYEKGYQDGLNADKWIPVEEGLPEDFEEVLVWFEYFRYGEYNRLFQTTGVSFTVDGKWSNFVNGSSGWKQLKIIAWQPLPQPYKKEGAE